KQGLFIGTSSWKYTGWCGKLYDEARYVWRGKLAESRFNKNCLKEYAEVFKTVCVDAAYYTFPTDTYFHGLMSQVPPDFQFGLKVTDEITVNRFPNLPRFGSRAGKPNDNFLNASLFSQAFLKPCESIRENIGVIMFEFSRFYPSDFAHGRDFVAALDSFFSKLPKGWPYAIEMRNRNWLVPEYFACLTAHGVTHVFNSWTAMPPVFEQVALPSSRTNPELVAARFLLRPGTTYEESVKAFSPYQSIQEVNEEARMAGAALMKERKVNSRGKTLIFVNNRLEGNALDTIAAMVGLSELE
ncbi:MAG: hypothetical protein JWN25_2986, partial [Verrucomicrobiales bacterium]|nr:hypothetical protein [Verrucomicrobiales bacterium]